MTNRIIKQDKQLPDATVTWIIVALCIIVLGILAWALMQPI